MTLGPYQSTCVRMYTNQLIEECVMAQRTQAIIEGKDRRLNHRVPKEPLPRSERRRFAVTLAHSPEKTGQDQLDSESDRPALGETERVRTSLMT